MSGKEAEALHFEDEDAEEEEETDPIQKMLKSKLTYSSFILLLIQVAVFSFLLVLCFVECTLSRFQVLQVGCASFKHLDFVINKENK